MRHEVSKATEIRCDCGSPIKARLSKGRHGVKKPGADHDLCQKCWRAARDRNRLVIRA